MNPIQTIHMFSIRISSSETRKKFLKYLNNIQARYMLEELQNGSKRSSNKIHA